MEHMQGFFFKDKPVMYENAYTDTDTHREQTNTQKKQNLFLPTAFLKHLAKFELPLVILFFNNNVFTSYINTKMHSYFFFQAERQRKKLLVHGHDFFFFFFFFTFFFGMS